MHITLKDQIDIAWAAGLFEGEGTVWLHTYRGDEVAWRVGLTTCDEDVIRRFAQIIGVGKVYGPYTHKNGRDGRRRDHHKIYYRWQAGTREDVRYVANMLLPYLGERRAAKIHEALEWIATRDKLP
jgi:hypothetical protein